MAKNRMILIGLCLIAGIGICFPKGSMCYLMLYGCVFLLLLSILQSILVFRKLHISIGISNGKIKKGEDAVCFIRARNESRLLSGQVKMTVNMQNKKQRVLLQAACRNTAKEEVVWHPAHCGKYEVSCQKVRSYDGLGIFSICRFQKLPSTWFLVMPTIYAVTSLSEEEWGQKAKWQTDPSLSYEVRKYQRGDSMKRIHWKISAKERELYTRLEEEEARPEVAVYIDARKIQAEKEAYYEIRGKLIETALSVIHFWFVAGYKVNVYWEDGRMQARQIADMHQWEEILLEITALDFNGTELLKADNTGKNIVCNYIVHQPDIDFCAGMNEKDKVWLITDTESEHMHGVRVPLFHDITEL